MRKVGEILKTTREAKHISQQEVASHLNLKIGQVEAIENGNWGSLPEAAYVKGFIKNYAHFLHLDSEKLLALHRAEYDERKFIKP
ncbi:MAG TPA: helix-turn-helix domain-containing protein, partial [Candidatus Saccharimonadales bacterium]|nr:helix-turn-helix domain-containing protein [Candidatus Saccharimonadales bacterium]